MSMIDWTDAQVATAVRMLMRGQLDHEAICVLGRDRIMSLSAERDRLSAERDAAIEDNKRGEQCIGNLRQLAHECGWNGVENSKVLDVFLRQHIAAANETIETLRAELADVADARAKAEEMVLAERAERDAEIAGLLAAIEKIDRAATGLDQCATPEWRELGLNLRLVCRSAMGSRSEQHRKRIEAAWKRDMVTELQHWADHFGGITAIQPAPRYWQGKEDGLRLASAKLRGRAKELLAEADRLERGE